jgi:hypothetical protein
MRLALVGRFLNRIYVQIPAITTGTVSANGLLNAGYPIKVNASKVTVENLHIGAR